jgi:hypothetical protein
VAGNDAESDKKGKPVVPDGIFSGNGFGEKGEVREIAIG